MIKESNKLKWFKKPTTAILKKKNKNTWFSDGLFNVYENCVTNNLRKNLKNKTAIICIDKNKRAKQFTYQEIDEKVNDFCIYLKSLNQNIKTALIHSSASITSVISMLSFSKLGIHFSVVFEDLPIEAINIRIGLLKPDLIITRSINHSSIEIMKCIKKNNLFSCKIVLCNEKNNKLSYYDFNKKIKKKFRNK